MRILGLIVGLVLLADAQSQLVVSMPEWPQAGLTGDVVAGLHIEPTPGGAEPQSWDFGDVSGTAVSLIAINPAETSPFAPAFPNAEWVLSNGDALGFYVFGPEGEFTVVGNGNAAQMLTLPFDDPAVQWTYPLAFGDSASDDFSAEVTLFGQPYALVGSVSMTVDAHGSLAVPEGDFYPEVLRVVYDQVYEEAYDGDTAVWFYNQVSYHVDGAPLPVFFHEVLRAEDSGGNELFYTDDVAWYGNIATGVEEQMTLIEDMSVNPNPVGQGEMVDLVLPRGGGRIMDLGGRVIWSSQSGKEGVISISTAGWRPGPYILFSETGGRPVRFIVQ